MERVDVAIVGGGPAGSSAAKAAARHDAEALVIEKGVPREDRDGPGPDSTDAAGMLDYWIDLMDYDPEEIPDEVILSTLDGAEFFGPSEKLTLEDTGIDSSYSEFGFAFHRARFDDWLREEAEAAGANYRLGATVSDVDVDAEDGHTLTFADGDQLEADYVVLADGPNRSVTTDVLEEFMPEGERITDYVGINEANHIAYQEHRRIPEELFDPNHIKFWWGVMPGHTAYPWIFPNDEPVARVGLTMPIGMDVDEFDRDAYALLREGDERIPSGNVYLERMLEREYPDYEIEDFPLVEDRGKRNGTETYPISSTQPIESPVQANVAIAGGAMGTTSAFHEGGDHVAVRTGKIAGRLAATDSLERYNHEWKAALGDELRRNVTFAELVRGWGPDQWDTAFAAGREIQEDDWDWNGAINAGLTGIKIVGKYKWLKRGFRDGGYVQFREDDYAI